MMRKLILIYFIMFFFSTAVCEEIIIGGESKISKKKLARVFKNGNKSPDSLRSYLVNSGYIDAAITVSSDTFFINEGRLYLLKEIQVSNDSSKIIAKVPFTQSNFEAYVDAVIDNYKNAGYLYPGMKIDSITEYDSEFSAFVTVNTGPEMRVGKVSYLNLKRTSPVLVSRYLPEVTGVVLDERVKTSLEKSASGIPFVSFNPPVNILPKPGYQSADLELSFTEKRQFIFEGAAGIASSDASGSSLHWNINLKFQNIFGSGKNFSLLSDHRLKNRQILEVSYRQPIFLFGVGEWGLNITTRDYREQFYEFSASSKYVISLNNSSTVGLEGGWRTIEAEANLPSYRVISAGLSFSGGQVDDKLNPSSGWDVEWQIDYLYRRYVDDSLYNLSQSAYNEIRNDISLSWYHEIIGKFIGSLKLKYLGFETSEQLPPPAELYFIGGPKSLRGFRNEQFTALTAGLVSLEPRLKFSNGYLFAFYDGAYLKNRIETDNLVRDKEDYYNGYGLGISIVERHRAISVSLGWNKDIPFDNPYLSVEFISEI